MVPDFPALRWLTDVEQTSHHTDICDHGEAAGAGQLDLINAGSGNRMTQLCVFRSQSRAD